MKVQNRLTLAGIIVALITAGLGTTGGLLAWMFAVQDNTARTATATEFIRRSYEEMKIDVKDNQTIGFQNATRLNDHARRLDDHSHAIQTIKKGRP